jgi:hypothetical protein
MAGAVSTLQAWADMFRGVFDSDAGDDRGRGRRGRSAQQMLRYVECMYAAVGQSSLLPIIQKAVLAVLPWPLASGILQHISSHAVVPSKATMNRYRLVVDVAFLLLCQRVNVIPAARYMWADSSPTKTANWLWVEHHSIALEDLLIVRSASRLLTSCRGQEELLRSVQQHTLVRDREVQDALYTLKRCVVHHIYVPAGMASGRTDVAHKASAMLHSMAFNPIRVPVVTYRASFSNDIKRDPKPPQARKHLDCL